MLIFQCFRLFHYLWMDIIQILEDGNMFRKKTVKESYDKENQRPVVRASICTGEKVAGFKDVHTGKFTEVMLIRNDRDMDEFLERYEVSAEDVTKEW